MPSLRDYIFYMFPPGFVAFFVFTAAVLLAPVLLGEALALTRAAHGAQHRRWQQWWAPVCLVAGLGTLALAGIFWALYRHLQGYPSFYVAVCCSQQPYGELLRFDAFKQAVEIYETLAVPSVVWLIIAYALALAGLVALAVLRRQAEAAIDAAS